MAGLRAAGWRVAFVTNTSSLRRRAIADRLRGAGIDAELMEILTAGRAAGRYLREWHPRASVLLLNSGSIDEDLEGVHLTGHDPMWCSPEEQGKRSTTQSSIERSSSSLAGPPGSEAPQT